MFKEYVFYHGRVWLAWIYGIAFATILSLILLPLLNPILDAVSERGNNLYTIIILIPIFSSFLFIFLFPPERFNINIKCIGILHDEYVEIHKGKKILTQRYEEIERIHKVNSYAGFRIAVWSIGNVRIHKAVGVRKNHKDSELNLDSFIKEVESKVQMSQNR